MPVISLAARRPASDVLGLIGNTPLVRLTRVVKPGSAAVFGKLEAQNPGGSVKDRIALSMVEAAEAAGTLPAGGTLVEPTSGNTGIGLAIVAASKGYRLMLTMPEDMSLERRQLLARLGAKLVLTPAIEGMTGSVFAARELVSQHEGFAMLNQFENPANPAVHRATTAVEILRDLERRPDAFVAGVGTGGTITGVGEALKEQFGSTVRVVAVEPASSPVLQGGRFRPHAIQGIGASFVPGVLNRAVIDRVVGVSDADALAMTGRLAREEGLLVGVSSGANVWAAARVAEELGEGHTVVTVLCDTGERYLSVEF